MIAPGFHEEWFGELNQSVLAGLAAGVADLPGLVVEIGCWEGRSTCVLANAIAPRAVHCVDTWFGSGSEISAQLAAERDVFAQWSANVEAFTAGNVVAHRMGWREFVPTITDPVALVFIDAEHTHREVSDNVAAFLPLVPSGGVLCGDDAHHEPVRSAVLELLPGADVHGSMWLWVQP